MDVNRVFTCLVLLGAASGVPRLKGCFRGLGFEGLRRVTPSRFLGELAWIINDSRLWIFSGGFLREARQMFWFTDRTIRRLRLGFRAANELGMSCALAWKGHPGSVF